MRRSSRCFLLLLFLPLMQRNALVQQSTSASQAASAPQIPPPIRLEKVYKSFVGNWTGELEIRDLLSDQRAKLPAWLDVTLSPDGRGLQFHFIYDDGSNTALEEVWAVTIDPQISMFTVSSDREKSKNTYLMTGFDKFSSAGYGTLQMTGSATEYDKKVDLRITIKLGRNFYRYQKETRQAGGDFQFRNGYNFTRRDPPEPAR